MGSEGEERSSFSAGALAFCELLPKVELHAHLNGSVRDETIKRLVAEKQLNHLSSEVDDVMSKRHRGLADCFRLFDIIHQCTTDHASITQITREVIMDFAEDMCTYLELRTTPKHRPSENMTKESYTRAVLEGMNKAQEDLEKQGRWMMVKLLLSIDRREGPEAAIETVRLAVSLQGQGVVGVDLSGNPTTGNWQQWEGALKEAQAAGLGVTLHAGEVPAAEETASMMDFKPGRLGHMCVLTEALENQLLSSKIPVELCLTSNIKTVTFPDYPDHHFAKLHSAGHPVVLCTDDSGVFGTTLSQEYAIAMTHFKLSAVQMTDLALKAVDYTFLSDTDKAVLRNKMMAMLPRLPN